MTSYTKKFGKHYKQKISYIFKRKYLTFSNNCRMFSPLPKENCNKFMMLSILDQRLKNTKSSNQKNYLKIRLLGASSSSQCLLSFNKMHLYCEPIVTLNRLKNCLPVTTTFFCILQQNPNRTIVFDTYHTRMYTIRLSLRPSVIILIHNLGSMIVENLSGISYKRISFSYFA